MIYNMLGTQLDFVKHRVRHFILQMVEMAFVHGGSGEIMKEYDQMRCWALLVDKLCKLMSLKL